MPPETQPQNNLENNLAHKKEIHPPIFILLIILLAVLAGTYEIYQSSNLKPSTTQQSSDLTTLDPTSDWKTYRNDEYRFELALNDSYKNYSTEIEKPENSLGGEKYLTFQVDAKNYNWASDLFPVFTIIIYPIDWWNKNADIDENSYAWIKNQPHDLSTNLGTYISKNDKYAFTSTRGQDCPNELCPLYQSSNQILSTFKFTHSINSGQVSTSTISTIDISDWEGFVLPGWGLVSFNHPSDWIVVEKSKNDIEISKDNNKIDVYYYGDTRLTQLSPSINHDYASIDIINERINSFKNTTSIKRNFQYGYNTASFETVKNGYIEVHNLFYVGTLFIDVYSSDNNETYKNVVKSFHYLGY